MFTEKLQWAFTLFNTLTDLANAAGKFHEKLPEAIKQRMPKLFGLTLADEQIFNGICGLLKKEQREIIYAFLYKKCKNYEKNRFINIVAGMEIEISRPVEIEKNSKGGTKTKPGKVGTDRRQKFLESFAESVESYGYSTNSAKALARAYHDCIGGRMILKNHFHQKMLRLWANEVCSIEELDEQCDRLAKKINSANKKSAKKYKGFWVEGFGLFSRK